MQKQIRGKAPLRKAKVIDKHRKKNCTERTWAARILHSFHVYKSRLNYRINIYRYPEEFILKIESIGRDAKNQQQAT